MTVIAKSGGPRINYPLEINGIELLHSLWKASKGKGFRIAGEVASKQHAVLGGDSGGDAKRWSDYDRILDESESETEAPPCRYTVADGADKGKPFTVYRKVTTNTMRLLDRRTGAVLRQQAFRGKLAPCPTRRFEDSTASYVTDKSYDFEGRKRFVDAAAR